MVTLQPPGQVGRTALEAERDLIAKQMATGTGTASSPYVAGPAISTRPLPPVTVPGYSAPGMNSPPPMTQWEKKVLSLPALAKVKDYQRDYGFVVIDAGANRGLRNEQRFAIRRYNAIVGRITIHDVDRVTAVGDLESRSVPQGVLVEVGDDVVQDVAPEQ